MIVWHACATVMDRVTLIRRLAMLAVAAIVSASLALISTGTTSAHGSGKVG
jgi:hypothetical protein